MRLTAIAGGIMLVGLRLLAAAPQGPADEPAYFQTGVLTMQDRIRAQAQIERVYYRLRIWPKENPRPKPPFQRLVPSGIIERKAREALLKSAALNRFWNFEITPEMLQQEMDRMARDTRDPAGLRKLFAALGDDPSLIAETLSRDLLADRLIRDRYANDSTIHTAARARAEALRANPDWEIAA